MIWGIIEYQKNYIRAGLFSIQGKIGIWQGSLEDLPELIRLWKHQGVSKIFCTKELKDQLSPSLSVYLFDPMNLSLEIPSDMIDSLGPYKIANLYGALSLFPSNDCLIIHIDTSLSFDLISRHGHYIGSTSLNWPLDDTEFHPSPILCKENTIKHPGANYYALMGAIERVSDEICLQQPSSSSIKRICSFSPVFQHSISHKKDLEEITDLITFDLTLLGLNEIFKEHLSNQKEK